MINTIYDVYNVYIYMPYIIYNNTTTTNNNK